MTTPSPLATAIAEEIASQLLTEGVAYEFPKSETIKVALPVIQRHLTPLIEKVERQEKELESLRDYKERSPRPMIGLD